jgi:murein DD-endopeptidase MepM/ murein hydrolase activator NlpD
VKRRRGPGGRIIGAMLACFVAGAAIGWRLHTGPPVPAIHGLASDANPAETGGIPTPRIASSPPAAAPRSSGDASSRPPTPSIARGTGAATAAAVATKGTRELIGELRSRALRVPLDGVDIESFKGGFLEQRDSGGRPHEAVDMLAPRNTPVHAVENGTIAKLFVSKAGGNTIYQYDPGEQVAYYYAHLERYADGLSEGSKVSRGDVIGFVGTSGNAPANTPHLHFAVFELSSDHHWWQGTPLDPYLVFTRP